MQRGLRQWRRDPRRRRLLDPSRIDWGAVAWKRIDRHLARFDGQSLTDLLSCAADSPGGVHRLPSLSILWLRCLAVPPTGSVTASPSDLPGLLASAGRAARQLKILEDFAPADPRLLVRYAIGGTRLRIHPGSLGDPVQALRVITATAASIDPFVVERHGFGLSDLVEVALRYADHRLQVLSRVWPASDMPADLNGSGDEDLRARADRIASTPAAVTDAEVAAAAALGDAGYWISGCRDPGRAAAAWKWATRPACEVKVDLFPGAEHLGSVLAVSTPEGDRAVPASLVIGALGVATTELAREAAADEDCAMRMQMITEHRALAIFGLDAPDRLGGIAVVVPWHRHVFVVGLASGLDSDGLARSLDEAADGVREVTVDAVREAGGDCDPAGLVFRLIIYGGPVHGPKGRYAGLVCVHVDELLVAALDADQAATGEEMGRSLLWQFIDELATLPGMAELTAWDFADIWQVWLSRGALNPTGHQSQHVVALTVPDSENWERAAAWEPLEMALTGAGLPSSWDWTFAHLDGPGQATVGYLHNLIQLLADPPLILHVELEEGLADLGLDPAFAVGMADGIRLTFVNYPAVAAVLTRASDAPVVCKLRVEEGRLSETPADHVGVRMAARAVPAPSIELIFGADWLELLAEDPTDGQVVLGRALAQALRAALNLTDQASEDFINAWCEAIPVMALRRAETTLPPAFLGRNALPRSPATAARARRAIAALVVRADLPRAIYVGEAASGLLSDVILPAVGKTLAESVSAWSASALITVAEFLNDAHADRARRAGELANALTAPWGERWRAMALDQPEPALATRSMELILEMVLARETAGDLNADAMDIAEASDLAREALKVSLDFAAARSRLHDLEVLLDDDGLFAIRGVLPQRSGTAIDMGSYLNADRADRTRLHPEPLPGEPTEFTPGRPSERREFVPLREMGVFPKLLTADALLKDAYGTGFDGITAVLGIAATWTPRDDKVIQVGRAELREAVNAWSDVPMDEIEAAIDHLTLTAEQLRSGEIRYWEQERRSYRLAIRPLVSLGGARLLIIPRRIEATQGVFVGYLLDGRLPWPPSDLPQRVIDAFVDFRKNQNRQLERAVAAILDRLGLPYRANVESHHARGAGLQLTGEIDALAADPVRSRLWVCEVKDPSVTVSPSTVAVRVRRFLRPDGHVSHLLRSSDEVQISPAGWARFLGAPEPDRDWLVLPLMITRWVEPAAFAGSPSVPFVVLDDVQMVFQSGSAPEPGQVWPTSGLPT